MTGLQVRGSEKRNHMDLSSSFRCDYFVSFRIGGQDLTLTMAVSVPW
jgi:hypothetical protein